MIRERQRTALPGVVMLLLFIAGEAFAFWGLIDGSQGHRALQIAVSAIGMGSVGLLAAGLFSVAPNEGKVLQLFGQYVGTVRAPGLQWANPFYKKKRVSLRVRNFESTKLKVNDYEGNPIEIASVVVWRVIDTAEALFEVDDYNNYGKVQSEAALRNLATSYPYDSQEEHEPSLRGHTNAVADHLKRESQDRRAKAGVQVREARTSHLA